MFSALVAFTVASAISAQSFDYVSVLDMYARDARPAVDAITSPGIPTSAIEDAVAACLPKNVPSVGDVSPCQGRRRALAILLHTEAAIRLDTIDDGLSFFHLQQALRILPFVNEDPGFVVGWYHFGVMFVASRGDVRSASRLAEEVALRHREHAVPHYLRGLVKEVSTLFEFDDLHGPLAERRLDLAVRDYERALAIDATLVDARLRWGRIRGLRGRREGDEALSAVAASAPNPATRYLAQLFLGANAQRRDDLDSALRYYEAARSIAPGAQTACVAVSLVERLRAQADRANTIARACFETGSNDDPWWIYRRSAYDEGMVTALRERVLKAR
jgi:tetratricopeptide (TPR) repeat protein